MHGSTMKSVEKYELNCTCTHDVSAHTLQRIGVHTSGVLAQSLFWVQLKVMTARIHAITDCMDYGAGMGRVYHCTTSDTPILMQHANCGWSQPHFVQDRLSAYVYKIGCSAVANGFMACYGTALWVQRSLTCMALSCLL